MSTQQFIPLVLVLTILTSLLIATPASAHPNSDNANLTATYQYDAFGTTTQHSGTETPFQYAGEYQDEETGFIYLRARYYDPQTATFLTRDPIEHTTRDPYSYADNDPTNATDPSGFCVGIGCKWGKTWLGKAVVNFASGVLDSHPITATTNALGWSDTSQYANKNSGAFAAGQVAMNAVGPKGMGAGRSAGAATRSVKPPANACLPMRGGAGDTGLSGRGVTPPTLGVVQSTSKKMEEWIGPGGRAITNSRGDKVFISEDGLRRIRFDLKHPSPHQSPHAHVEELIDGVWWKSGPVFPKDLPHR